MGSETIITRLIDVMFVEAIRSWLKDQPEGSAGWLGALLDPAIGAALGLIHKTPEKLWTVPSLAAEVGMSRSPFAARFAALVGQAPMAYLKSWRLQLAARLPQSQTLSLSNIAEQVGYESTAAFSRVFKRNFGIAPGQFRRTAVIQLTSGRCSASAGERCRCSRRSIFAAIRINSGRKFLVAALIVLASIHRDFGKC